MDRAAAGEPEDTAEDFRQCLDALNRVSENTRTAVYVYLIVFGALLIWALNAIVYPAAQNRVDQIRKANLLFANCRLNPPPPGTPVSPACADVLGRSLATQFSSSAPLPPGRPVEGEPKRVGEALWQIDVDYISHELQSQFDKSAELARFSIPAIGVLSDRTWFWLVCTALGPFFGFLIRDSFTNVEQVLGYLRGLAGTERTRLVLLASTQVISASTRGDRARRDGGWKASRPKIAALAVLMALPLIVSGLVLYDWWFLAFATNGDQLPCVPVDPQSGLLSRLYNLHAVPALCEMTGRQTHPAFWHEPQFVGGILIAGAAVVEASLFRSIMTILVSLTRQHWEIWDKAFGRKESPGEAPRAAPSALRPDKVRPASATGESMIPAAAKEEAGDPAKKP
jgi:hypothetical protein